MLESLEIENFRGINKLKIDNFKNINFFIGKANTSKTSLLEAIYISLEQSPISLYMLFMLRNILKDDDAFESLFYDYNSNNMIYLNYIFNKKDINIKLQKDSINSFTISRNNNVNNVINKLLFIKKESNYENQFSIDYNYMTGNITINPEDKIYNDVMFITVENMQNNFTLYNNLKTILVTNMPNLRDLFHFLQPSVADRVAESMEYINFGEKSLRNDFMMF